MSDASLFPIDEIKTYLDRRFGREHPSVHLVRSYAKKDGLPDINIPPHIGNFLYLLAKIHQTKRILEIGTLGAYSSLWLVQALPPDGYLLSLESSPLHVAKAREYIQKTNEKRIEIKEGKALMLLPLLVTSKTTSFDFIFIDADKKSNALYLDWALQLSHSGTLILIDNIIPKGEKIGYPNQPEAEHVYAFNDYLSQHPCLESVALPVLNSTRCDGLALARVK